MQGNHCIHLEITEIQLEYCQISFCMIDFHTQQLNFPALGMLTPPSFWGPELWTKAPNYSQLESRACPSAPLLIQALLKKGSKLPFFWSSSSILAFCPCGYERWSSLGWGRIQYWYCSWPAAMALWPDGKEIPCTSQDWAHSAFIFLIDKSSMRGVRNRVLYMVKPGDQSQYQTFEKLTRVEKQQQLLYFCF